MGRVEGGVSGLGNGGGVEWLGVNGRGGGDWVGGGVGVDGGPGGGGVALQSRLTNRSFNCLLFSAANGRVLPGRTERYSQSQSVVQRQSEPRHSERHATDLH